MSASANTKSKTVSIADIKDRGGDLALRLRVAGFPRYNRWFAEHNPKWEGDEKIAYRIRMILNERGGADDLGLLKECEALADRYLPKRAA